jgi:DNA-binding transcriptional ArsR family regulator
MSAAKVAAEIKALSESEREQVFRLLIQDETLREDLLDSLIIEQRQNEPSRPLADILKDYLSAF